MYLKPLSLAISVSLLSLTACSFLDSQASHSETQSNAITAVHADTSFNIAFEKFTLENGLEVVFHLDKSDPVVAVTLAAHVGSAREIPGKTGFAHLFEHLLFLESENLGKGGIDKLSARVGGSGAGGSTSRDITNYMQTVPNDALEKMLWAEADKLGYFINTVTKPVLEQEKEVVKNEKRQRVDNQPYGHVFDVLSNNLYPNQHPYNWLPLGSLEDLASATVDDVKAFYQRWYVPNNVTLVVAGDFDPQQAKAWVNKYFNDIPRGPEVKPLTIPHHQLADAKKFYHEDNFAQTPQLTYAWPTVARFHPDSYALDVLIALLTEDNQAPLTNELVEQQKVTSDVMLIDLRAELAGELLLMITAFEDIDLDQVEQAVGVGLQRFESAQFTDADLSRIKTGLETRFYRSLSSVEDKAVALADYNILLDDPAELNKQVSHIRKVNRADVWRVYNKYLKSKPFVSTSFVPKGKKHLAVSGAQQINISEEDIVLTKDDTQDSALTATYNKTPSHFDRSVEPPFGAPPVIPVPDVKTSTLSNALEVLSLYSAEVPLVEIKLTVDGGLLLETSGKNGTANLLANMLTRGTADKTPEALSKAITQLGSSIKIEAERDSIVIKASALARNYAATMALISEMLTRPRWDLAEFELSKKSVQGQLRQSLSDAEYIAQQQLLKLIYPDNHPLANSLLGNEESLAAITIDDLKTYHQQNIAPQLTRLYVAGAVEHSLIVQSLSELASGWQPTTAQLPALSPPALPAKAAVYFYDIPGAKQSTLYIGQPAVSAKHPDFFKLQAMNYILGGGGFSSRLTQEIRVNKGYTYGIRSKFNASPYFSWFAITSNVRTNVTLESLLLTKQIVGQYSDSYTEVDLATTKTYYQKSNARRFETLTAKLQILENIDTLGLPYDFIQHQTAQLDALSKEDMQLLARQYIKPEQLIYVVVGDADSQAQRLKALGLGEITMLN